MNKDWTVYDPATGLFTGTHLNCDDAHVAINTPPGHAVIAGRFDHLSQRLNLSAGAVEDWQPPQPSPAHEWDTGTKRWRLTADAVQREARRSEALSELTRFDAAEVRALTEHVLGVPVDPGQPTAMERLAAIHATKIELRKKLNE